MGGFHSDNSNEQNSEGDSLNEIERQGEKLNPTKVSIHVI